MCMTVRPALLSKTIVYAGQSEVDGKLVHVMGYSNTAENKSDSPNAMLLPFPSSIPMTEKNILSTDKCKDILKNMAEALEPKDLGGDMSKGMRRRSFTDSVKAIVFESDIYTVVLAKDARAVHGALDQVPENKRPDISEEYLNGYYDMYPDWQVALCCFDNTEATKAPPLLWWYKPKFKSVLFFPTTDSHNGKLPRFDKKIKMDHTLIAGTGVRAGATGNGHKVSYGGYWDTDAARWKTKDLPTQVKQILPKYVCGQVLQSVGPSWAMGTAQEIARQNGDIYVQVSDVMKGKFQPVKAPPPGIANA